LTGETGEILLELWYLGGVVNTVSWHFFADGVGIVDMYL